MDNSGKKYFRALAAGFLILAGAACKKDDEETAILPSLGGTLRINAPAYVFKGEKIEMTPSGVKHPAGGTLGFHWKVTPEMDSNDTSKLENGAYTYTFPDSLGTFTVTCTAFASGYYSTSASKYVTTVDPDETLTDMGFTPSDGMFKDDRDGRIYRYTKIGNLEWFRQNLAYSGDGDAAGMPYENAIAMNDIFGRYYVWSEAADACPEGWRLPAEEDWVALGTALSEDDPAQLHETFAGVSGKMMANAKFNGETMWEYWPDVKITNESGFSAIPSGFANKGEGTGLFFGASDYAVYWTGTTRDDDPDQAYYRYIYCDKPDLFISSGYKDVFAANVRCVRNAQ